VYRSQGKAGLARRPILKPIGGRFKGASARADLTAWLKRQFKIAGAALPVAAALFWGCSAERSAAGVCALEDTSLDSAASHPPS
jgi:hypothetical protein